jgi:hypothetical protein
LRGGGLPVDDGMELAIFGGFTKIEAEKFNMTPSGMEIVSMWDKEEPTPLVIRKLLLPLVLKIMPPWMVFASGSPEERLAAIAEGWKELLINAELLGNALSEDATNWWAALQRRVDETDEQLRNTIGEIGENLTMKYEKERLLTERRFELAEKVKWVSKESDAYGFDIASFFGSLQVQHQKPDNMMMVEVKSTTSNSTKSFRFFLTRNEWETAERNTEHYFFYLWGGINVAAKNASEDNPLILPADLIRQYIPFDKHEQGRWMECLIELDLQEIRPCVIDPTAKKDYPKHQIGMKFEYSDETATIDRAE